MTDKHQSELYLENCIQRNIDDKIKKYLIKTAEVMLTNSNSSLKKTDSKEIDLLPTHTR